MGCIICVGHLELAGFRAAPSNVSATKYIGAFGDSFIQLSLAKDDLTQSMVYVRDDW